METPTNESPLDSNTDNSLESLVKAQELDRRPSFEDIREAICSIGDCPEDELDNRARIVYDRICGSAYARICSSNNIPMRRVHDVCQCYDNLIRVAEVAPERLKKIKPAPPRDGTEGMVIMPKNESDIPLPTPPRLPGLCAPKKKKQSRSDLSARTIQSHAHGVSAAELLKKRELAAKSALRGKEKMTSLSDCLPSGDDEQEMDTRVYLSSTIDLARDTICDALRVTRKLLATADSLSAVSQLKDIISAIPALRTAIEGVKPSGGKEGGGLGGISFLVHTPAHFSRGKEIDAQAVVGTDIDDDDDDDDDDFASGLEDDA
jgi:hypothetical protein